MSISVLTIVRGRQSHLENQRLGLLQSVLKPAEWIIVGMGQDVDVEQTQQFRIVSGRVDGVGGNLPLAEARNRAAELCQSEQMVFLDVDCIPSPRMLTEFDRALALPSERPRLLMGNALYLPAGATSDGWEFSKLRQQAVQHPLLPELSDGAFQSSNQYERFWSLCFGVQKKTYDQIGGFDSSFEGYGGEDTDFAFQARDQQIEFGFVGATVFHQHHTVCKPPLNHLEAIVANARIFHGKWDVWPMESWINQFVEMNLVNFNPDQQLLEVVRVPTEEEIKDATTSTPAGF